MNYTIYRISFLIVILLNGIGVFAQTPRVTGTVVGYRSSALIYRNWDVPQTSLGGGTWEVRGGTKIADYDGGTYTSIRVNADRGTATVTVIYRYMDLGTSTTYELEFQTLIRDTLRPGNILYPTTTSIPNGIAPPQLTVSGAGGGYGILDFSWQQSVTPGVWEDMGVGTENLTPPVMNGTVSYRRAVTSDYSKYSPNITLVETVYTDPVQFIALPALNPGSLTPTTQTIPMGTPAGGITGTAGSGGDCGTAVSYQWQQSYDSLAFFDIPGAVSANFTPAQVNSRTFYRRVAKCGPYSSYSNVSEVMVNEYVSLNYENENYVRTYDLLKPGIHSAYEAEAAPGSDKIQSTNYFDGLGRSIQTVVKEGSAAGADVVQPIVYDNAGRQPFAYQSYASSSTPGKFKNDPLTEYNSFMSGKFPGEGTFYSKTIFEESPLNRVEKVLAPGNSWGGSNRGTQSQSGGNNATEGVRIWKIAAASGSVPVTTSVYDDGALLKQVTIDEHDKYAIEYKDKQGKVILKKVQLDAGPSAQHDGWLCTYYVYDELDQLRFVLSPKAIDMIKNNGWSLTDPELANGLCFQYAYDARKRMVWKKVPGAAAVEMVYDVRDRLVFSRDGSQKNNNRWLVTFYDDLNRPVETALYLSSATRETLQAGLDNVTGSSAITTTLPAIEMLVVPSRDPAIAQYKARKEIVFTNGFESGNNEVFETEIDPNMAGTAVTTIVNNPLPGIQDNQLYPLSYTYYDQYPSAAPSFNTAYLSKLESGNSTAPETPTSATTLTNGLTTGKKTRILDTDQWLTAVNYYDSKGRLLQVISDNINGGKDIITNRYDFSGKVISSYTSYQNPLGATIQDARLLTVFKYDRNGRLTSTEKQLNDEPTWRRAVGQQEYNELGQISRKTLGNNLESLEYNYNIRGWLGGINKNFATTGSGHYFGTSLHYDDGLGATSQYNGNISSMTWRSAGDGRWRAYNFGYDAANRLLAADFNENPGSGWAKNPLIDFSVSGLTYDANGNIGAMTQKGMKSGTSSVIDQLTYAYKSNSNQLVKVTDAANDPSSTLGDFKDQNPASTQAYNYDVNGNLTEDYHKNIDRITYNILNLPTSVHINGKGTINYVYDASGIKLKKVVTDSTANPIRVTTTSYLGSTIYQNDSLQFIAHEEGRIRPVQKSGQPLTYVYDYFVKDHLGNVRMVLTEQSDFSMYTATMEPQRAATESALFTNVDATRTPKPVGYPQDPTVQSNAYVARLNGSNPERKIGPSLVLRVMAGDTIGVGARAFYKSIGNPGNKSTAPVADMARALASAFGNGQATQAEGVHGGGRNNTPFTERFYGNEYQRLKQKEPGQGNQTNRPKAYLNFVLFDDQFKLVEENSGVKQVQAQPDQLQTLAQDKMVMQKSGFLYVYTSNETPQDVFFDNVTVLSNPGPVLEETHYYPFGLTMEGISTKAVGSLENRYKYNGIEKIGEFGLEDYDAKFRELDPQIGRWWQVDPKTDASLAESPYASMGNNPISHQDPLGDYFFGLFGSTSAQRQAARAAVEELEKAGGYYDVEIKNKHSKKIRVSYTINHQTVDPESGRVAATASARNLYFRENGRPDFGNTLENTAYDRDLASTALSNGNRSPRPYPGTAEYVAAEAILVPLPPVFKLLGQARATTLYRSVSQAELSDIAANGLRVNSATGYESGKLFATTVEDAARFGRNNFGFDGVPNTIIQVKVPAQTIRFAEKKVLDGMNAVKVPSGMLNSVKNVKTLNFTPYVKPGFGGF